MSREPHKRYLEKVAVQAVEKAASREGRRLEADQIAELRIQTVEPWKRIVVAAVAVSFWIGSFYAFREESMWFGVSLLGIGTALFVLALVGKKKPIDAALDGIDFLYHIESLFP